MPVPDQQPFGDGTPLQERGLEAPGDRQPELALVAGVGVGQAFELGCDGDRVEDLVVAGGLIGGSQHGAIAIAEPWSCVTGGSVLERRAAKESCLVREELT